MATINTLGMTASKIERLNAALEKRYNFGDTIRTLGEELATFPERPLKSITNGMIDYRRSSFNRMDGRRQEAYMARLEKKRYYVLHYGDSLSMGLHVPKIVFDAVPGHIFSDVDQKGAA